MPNTRNLPVTPEMRDLLTGVIARTMRNQGFTGDIDVSNIRRMRAGFSATVVATYRLHRATYRATVGGMRSVTVKRVTDPVRLTQ